MNKNFRNFSILTLLAVAGYASYSYAQDAHTPEEHAAETAQPNSPEYKKQVEAAVAQYEEHVKKAEEFEKSDKFDNSILDAPLSSEVIIGDSKAPVTIVEYASLSCGHCKAFHDEVFYKLKADLIDTGKVYFKYRHFPLNKPALKAAALVTCAPADMKLAFLGALFKAQSQWSYVEDEATLIDKLKTMSKIGGIGTDEFNTCYDAKDSETELLEHMRLATEKLNVDSTPTIFINGKKYMGLRTFEAVKAEVEKVSAAAPAKKATEAKKEAPKAE